MIELLPLVAILGTTLFMMATGTLWYSDMFLAKYWMSSTALTADDMTNQKTHLLRNLVLTFASYFSIISVVVLLSFIMRTSDISPYFASLFVWLVIVAVQTQSVLWEKRSWVYVVITGGFYGLICFGGLAMVLFWPW